MQFIVEAMSELDPYLDPESRGRAIVILDVPEG